MSYNDYDVLRDSLAEVQFDLDEIDTDRLLVSLHDYYTKKNAERIWNLAEDWHGDHGAEAEDAPEYVKGVYRGIIIAARELDGVR